MNPKKDSREKRARAIAAAVTFGIALIILVLLFVLTLGPDRKEMAYASMPEIQDVEEVYLEPELMPMEDAGEPDATVDDSPAPEAVGTPEKAPEVQAPQVPSQNEPVNKKAPKAPLVTQQPPSPVEATEPPKNERDPKAAKAPNGATFAPNNGKGNAMAPTYGSGGTGVGVKGMLSGRSLENWHALSPSGQGTVTVKVKVLVNAAGKVVDAKIESANKASKDDRDKCIAMALQSKWSEKKGAPDEWGILTFTITHK